MKTIIKVSASRIKLLTKCSYQFYLQEIEKLPQRKWSRTQQGQIIHSIFESLLARKRIKTLEYIIIKGFDINHYPNIIRYIHTYHRNKDNLGDYTIESMGEMLKIAFMSIKPYFTDSEGNFTPPKRYSSEERFEFKVGDATLSGFIDMLIELSNGEMIILDLKSQKNRFTKDEMSDNIQAFMYQLAVYEKYGKLAKVIFVMLRHPPTTRTPEKFLQVVPATPICALSGLKQYVTGLYHQVNSFGLKEALSSPCQDYGFCRNVCTYFQEFKYQSLRKKLDNTLVKNFMLDEKVKVCDDEFIEIRTSHKCPVARRD